MVKYLKRILGIDELYIHVQRLEAALEMLPHGEFYLRKVDQAQVKKESQRYEEIERDRKLRRKG